MQPHQTLELLDLSLLYVFSWVRTLERAESPHGAHLCTAGIFECCVSPILIRIISAFYVRDEQAKRIGAFYVCNGFAQMIGGLLAFGITFYKGEQIAEWRVSRSKNV